MTTIDYYNISMEGDEGATHNCVQINIKSLDQITMIVCDDVDWVKITELANVLQNLYEDKTECGVQFTKCVNTRKYCIQIDKFVEFFCNKIHIETI